jgi:L-fucose mutarotase
MLKGIHPLLTADLLHALAAMGHGDEIAIVDANFRRCDSACASSEPHHPNAGSRLMVFRHALPAPRSRCR